ncbi:hypothetical protein BCR35DRAFT_290214 [Leucosporidium creatinivorum]|uniref:Phospholipase/carboxylesterase/thioesterase domain-containing protein n=1 Tax=Leucosporidium creatinivorum TaxID=106004 RepID=A0A1Y2FL07_9BASI|nr:hypothetical protein BCR35DRAFT_290214 [Leucosporidium creatinivorum]
MAELNLQPAPKAAKHAAPQLKSIDSALQYSYRPSPSGVDSNLLILFHGLGDTYKPFAQLGTSLNLPQTAVLSLQAPGRVPLLEEEAWCWWPSFDELGELIPNPNPSSTLSLLLRILTHLISTSPGSPSWSPSSIHLFGFAQGGTCAGELSLAFTRSTKLSLGSAVVVSAPLLSHPTVEEGKRSEMKVLLCSRKGEERAVGAGSWRKGFKEVKEVPLARGEGMLRGQSEWMEVMRFWSQVLTQRSALELSEGVYEVRGGVAAAEKAGASAP